MPQPGHRLRAGELAHTSDAHYDILTNSGPGLGVHFNPTPGGVPQAMHQDRDAWVRFDQTLDTPPTYTADR